MDGGWVREREGPEAGETPDSHGAQDLEQMCAKVRDTFGGGLSRYLNDCEGTKTGKGAASGRAGPGGPEPRAVIRTT